MSDITAKATGSFFSAIFWERPQGDLHYRKHNMTDNGGTWKTKEFSLPAGQYDYVFVLATGVGVDYETEVSGAQPASTQKGTVPRDGEVKGGFTVA